MADTASCNPLLPGGVGLTHLLVYDTIAPDGHRGGSAHIHFACTECYYIQAGAGKVQTLSAQGFQEIDLTPGKVVWFSPGVVHRLINLDGKLEIFVVMQNGGLPEAGDFVLTMPPDIIANPSEYFEVASLSPHGEVFTNTIDAAYRRRDMAIEGFTILRRALSDRGPVALEEFYKAALPLIAPKLPSWQNVWRNGPVAAADQTGANLEAMLRGDTSHLLNGAARSMPMSSERRLGMCGTLGTYLPEGVTVAAK